MTINTFDAEGAALGSILISPECLRVASDILTPQDFGKEINRVLYQAMLNLDRQGGVMDPVTILQETERMGAKISRQYVLELMDTTPTANNVEEYAKITRENALRRELVALCDGTKERLDQGGDTQEILSGMTQQLDKLQQEGVTSDLVGPDEAMDLFYTHRLAVDSGQKSGFVPTGYRDLDNLLGGGLLASGMYVLAARPGMGKTALALNIADRVAKQTGSVLFVSLEMDTEQIEARRISRESGIPSNRLLMKILTDEENAKMAVAADRVRALPMSINRKPGATVEEIKGLARRVPNLALIVIDYIGKITPAEGRRNASLYENTSKISGDLKTLARTFKTPVLALCQLSREVENRRDKRPQLSDLRDTGAIEQDADGVMFLYRENYYKKDEVLYKYAPEPLEVIVEKNRHGATGDCELTIGMSTGLVSTKNNEPRRAYRESEEFKQAAL